MNATQPNDLLPTETSFAAGGRATEVVVDALSLTINGMRFFRCPTEQELTHALGVSSKRADHSYVWDSAGVVLHQTGDCYVVELAIDRQSQTQHGYEGSSAESFNGSITVFNRNLPSKPDLNQLKPDFECNPRTLHFNHPVDFERIRMANLDSDQVTPLHVEVYVGRFPPKPVLTLSVTFTDNKFQRDAFALHRDEAIVATHGLYCDQFWFAITNKRFIALKRDILHKTTPAGDWSLADVRGFHILARPKDWWNLDYFCQQLSVELLNSTVHLRGFFQLLASNAFRRDRADAERTEQFFRHLRMAIAYATRRTADVSCTQPASDSQVVSAPQPTEPIEPTRPSPATYDDPGYRGKPPNPIGWGFGTEIGKMLARAFVALLPFVIGAIILFLIWSYLSRSH